MTGRNSSHFLVTVLATAIDSAAKLSHCVSYAPESMAAMRPRPCTRPIELIPAKVKRTRITPHGPGGKRENTRVRSSAALLLSGSKKGAVKRSPGISLPTAGCSRVWITALRALLSIGAYAGIGGFLRSPRSTMTRLGHQRPVAAGRSHRPLVSHRPLLAAIERWQPADVRASPTFRVYDLTETDHAWSANRLHFIFLILT